MTSDDRYPEGTAHAEGPHADQRPEQVLGSTGRGMSKEADRIMYLEDLRSRIESGEYHVDVYAVAESIMERLEDLGERLKRRAVEEHVRERVSAEVVEPQ